MASPQSDISDTTDPLLLENEGALEGYGKETYTMLKYILQEIAEEQLKAGKSSNDPLRRAQHYTGLHIDTLKKLHQDNVNIDKLTEIDRKIIHDTLMSFYLDKNIMPNATELFNSLQEHLPPYEDIRSFRKLLVKMGYIFKKIENSFVVYEKPSIRFERFLYLKKISQYRQDEKHIYYISGIGVSDVKVWNINETNIFNEKNMLFFILFTVSSLKGVKFCEIVTKLEKNNINSWILNDVIPNLQQNSVVVLENSKHFSDTYCETPNKSSSSYELMDWLKFHDVPFNKSMSIVDLYSLAEKYTDLRTKLYKPDIWLRQNGHDVLRLPDCINQMTPARHIHDHIERINYKEGTVLIEQMKCLNETIFSSFNLALAKEESRLFDLEIKLDLNLDNLQPSKYLESDIYLPSLSDSE